MKRLALAFCILGFSSIASAEQGDLAVQLRTVAYHTGSAKMNDVVPGIGVEYELIDRVKVGYIYGRNSIPSDMAKHENSNWLQAQYIFYRDPKWDAGVMASFANGYETNYVHDNIRRSVALQGCYKTDDRVHVCGHYQAWTDAPTQVTSVGLVLKFLF